MKVFALLVALFFVFLVVINSTSGTPSRSATGTVVTKDDDWLANREKACKDVAGGFYSTPC